MKADEPRQNRIPFMMSDSELQAVDDWRFSNKIGTRAEAIRRLVQMGLSLDQAAEDIRDEVEKIQSAKDRLNPYKQDTFEEDVEAKPSPEQADLLKREISVRTYGLSSTLRALLWRRDAFRGGSTVEEAAALAERKSVTARRVHDAYLRSIPKKLRKSMGLDDDK